MRKAACFIGLILATSCSSQPTKVTAEKNLLSPYELPTYKPGPGGDKYRFKSCPTTDRAVVDFDFHMFYSDPPVNSKVDPKKYADFKDKQRIIQNYAKKVGFAANTYLFNKSDDGARCAARLLKDWAGKNAMLGSVAKDPNDLMARMQALFVRKWVFGELTNAYLKIRTSGAITESDKTEILSWFRKLAPEVQRSYLRKNPLTNNHATWAGVSLMSASIALNDRDLFEFAMAKYKEAVDQIQNDGTLPQELARGSQALHYHNWVLTPLSIIATFAEANGVDLWTYKNKRINLLTQLLVPTLGSPDEFKKINGITPDREFIGSDSAWTELIYRRDHDLKIKAYLEKSRPIEEYWFDWDMTASFGEI